VMVLVEIIWAAGGIVLVLSVLATGAWVLQGEEEERGRQPARHPRQRGARCGVSIREEAGEWHDRHARAIRIAAPRRSRAA